MKFSRVKHQIAAIPARESDEAAMFDKEALRELNVERFGDIKDEHLQMSDERISMHLNFRDPPSSPYRYALFLLQDLTGKMILDHCCGSGETSVIIAKKGPAVVQAFDISPISVSIAKRRMRVNGVDRIVKVERMSAYSMTYPDNFFDIAYGNAVLHHLDLEIALKEIWRVLKPGGKAIFCEPFAGSKTLQSIRNLTPIKGDLSPHERQLNFDDIKMISQYFSSSKTRYKFIGLLSRLNRMIQNEFFRDILHDFDYAILNSFPILNRFSKSIVMEAIK